MCATPSFSSTQQEKLSAPTNQQSKPNFNRNKKRFSQGKKTGGTTGSTSNSSFQKSSAQKPNGESRNAKRARWAKKNKPVAKPLFKRGPEKEYISACCSVPARKPRAGEKMAEKDPESGRTKDKAKGLGHWRCGQCGKPCKVTPRKPEPKPVGNMGDNTVPCVVFPAKLQTPILEVPIAEVKPA